jgi:hypothetical protein
MHRHWWRVGSRRGRVGWSGRSLGGGCDLCMKVTYNGLLRLDFHLKRGDSDFKSFYSLNDSIEQVDINRR